VIVVAASEIAEPMSDLAEQYSDIFWYCNCGAGFPESELYAQSLDDSSEISYTAGYATGLLLQAGGGTKATVIGCCDLSFETEALLAFEAGLQAVDATFTVDYVPIGDFNDVAAATEAFNNALSSGTNAIYPFLGGAHEPVVQLANENGLITMSAGASNACERTDLDYQIAVRFDAGDYIQAQIGDMIAGDFTEGSVKTFHVGVDPEPGAQICDATDEQQAVMDDVTATIASGDLAEEFGEIKAEAYGG
jgi:basic membrane protein A